jgi:polysaccharide export outer membrane protein
MDNLYFRNSCFLILFSIILVSCSFNGQVTYLKDSVRDDFYKVDYSSINNNIEVGDILKIDIQTVVPEAALPYNIHTSKTVASDINLLNIEGYVVNKNMIINYPTLGNISVKNLSENQLAEEIKKLLVDGDHLNNPHVKVRRVNSKFTVLGEVSTPGTFPYFDRTLNIFQALGYAGDITISGKRKNITLIREENGIRKIYDISLSKSELLNKPYYLIKNNDIIIVKPNFTKVKSAGFIGSPATIASISSLIVSITLLLLNN